MKTERPVRRLVRRDPFARWSLMREVVDTNLTCTWCGGRRRNGRMFQYVTEHDGGREDSDNRVYCSIGCYDSYHA